jgi:L-ascorbate metabolism protein UlaG (beta-lactamase superfamily)
MTTTWYGQACFKIQSGDTVIAIDPFAKEIGLTPPRFQAHLALVTHDHYDHNNVSSLGGEPFTITSPGEYEVRGVYVRGIETYHDASGGKERGLNTVYTIDVEGIRIAHLGDFGEAELRNETLEQLGDVTVLMLPVGGTYTIDAGVAVKIVNSVEPRYVIPMHYKIPGIKANLASVDAFLKEVGATKVQPQDKFILKKKDIGSEDKQTEVILLKTT